MLDKWLAELVDLVNALLGRPEGVVKTVILAIVAVIVMVVVMRLAGRAGGMGNCENGPLVVAAALGLALALAGSVVAALYVVPGIDVPALRLAAGIGIPLVITLAVGVPLQCAILRSRYAGVLIGFLSGIVAALLAVMIIGAAIGSIRGGAKGAKNIRNRAESVNKIIGK